MRGDNSSGAKFIDFALGDYYFKITPPDNNHTTLDLRVLSQLTKVSEIEAVEQKLHRKEGKQAWKRTE